MQDGRIVEYGSRKEVLEQPRHPYTRELLAAVPRLNGGVAADFLQQEALDAGDHS